MRILQYNIWNGCREPERFSRLDRWIREQHYDLIGFNELKGWDHQELAACAEAWGYPYSAIFETRLSKHFIGVIAKYPIRLLETIEKPMHHGVLHVLINDVHFILTHMSPRSSVSREHEAALIAKMASSIHEPLVVMGDLNTLSPLDRNYYANSNLLDIVKQNEKLFNKFGSNGELNYKPMELLLDGGLTDVGFADAFQYTVPTHINLDKMHVTQLRLDYILVNKQLLLFEPKATILRNDELHELSDHYPIECEWGIQKT